MSEKRRVALVRRFQARALCVSIGRASVEEIDRLNVLQASQLAMQRAVAGLSVTPDHVLVDGNKVPDLYFNRRRLCRAIRVPVISAASIVAKVERDGVSCSSRAVSEYGFESHKGYPTAKHRRVLRSIGPVPRIGGVTRRYKSRWPGSHVRIGNERGACLLPMVRPLFPRSTIRTSPRLTVSSRWLRAHKSKEIAVDAATQRHIPRHGVDRPQQFICAGRFYEHPARQGR